jgi:hypothetical protein
VFKSQANVAVQGSSTLASSSSIETIQFFMAIVAKENNYTLESTPFLAITLM